MNSVEEMQAKEMEDRQNKERRRSIMDQILEPAAKDRMTRLAYFLVLLTNLNTADLNMCLV